MIRVTSPGLARTVSFQPVSLGSGGRGGPTDKIRFIWITDKCSTTQYLKSNKVQVNRMGIRCSIVKLPNLYSSVLWGFCYRRLIPHPCYLIKVLDGQTHRSLPLRYFFLPITASVGSSRSKQLSFSGILLLSGLDSFCLTRNFMICVRSGDG